MSAFLKINIICAKAYARYYGLLNLITLANQDQSFSFTGPLEGHYIVYIDLHGQSEFHTI